MGVKMTINRDVGQMSTELEFPLYHVEAEKIISHNSLPVMHEINMRDVVELNVSLANNIAELNAMTKKQIFELSRIASIYNGNIYGGSSVLSDIIGLVPKRHRTTSLSESCAIGFMDITSQQAVLGVNEESLGFELYNFFRKINPILLAISASSPYVQKGDRLKMTGGVSRRIEQYKKLCNRFPFNMWRDMPELTSLEEYKKTLSDISNEVIRRLYNGELDANWEELNKLRMNCKGTYKYIDFSKLEPHQIYWFNRVRPDHCNIHEGGKSLFSLELRIPDMPTTIERIQLMNTLIAGLSYYIADHGKIPLNLNGNFEDLEEASKYGLDSELNRLSVRELVSYLRTYSEKGLAERGYACECERFNLLESVLSEGNDATLIRKTCPNSPEELRKYLIGRMQYGE